jgi:hypothetical protein
MSIFRDDLGQKVHFGFRYLFKLKSIKCDFGCRLKQQILDEIEFDFIFIMVISVLQPEATRCNRVTHCRISPKGIGMIVPNNQQLAIEIDK